ncbi:nicotinate-nucleotide--dimethylbenzimidazole phosphoribosyltransferase [Acetobacter estunensis]|uniref:nicotinate-nucleotide--dimethylbenzimidazole phosphoribosyltransferase n=1 Tax=Acetobacter estunensis TaxID=104097 RepID=UPI001C2CE4C1|nr:nicotinate-nucleotide--dimethylbenzimidazole phosphoribosyltransferase [Acetobacter estunensis]MBV1836177.1 nicotinate-nucleotide--dimethylbenzimidazole phosphoribosyltransferase [Acetobacter estunensis]
MTAITFSDISALRSACLTPSHADMAVIERITARDATLTKPPGSLGRLEELTRWLGGWQRRPTPTLESVQCIVFAGNHGIVARGVSAWPPEVTTLMVRNFHNGGAAINQLSACAGASLSVVEMENLQPTADFTQASAMDEATFLRCVNTGAAAVDPKSDLLCVGEMGIGNTTVAAALAAGLFGGTGREWAGPGAGSDDASMVRKIDVINDGLNTHRAVLDDPLAVAQCLGGHEMAAMLGAVIAARHLNIPVMLDGYVSTAAVAPLYALHAEGLDHCRIGHNSAEPGHTRLTAKLGQKALLDFGLRLGEGSGAALVVPLLRAAIACHNGMHTFNDAGIGN